MKCSFACFYHVGEMSFTASCKCKKHLEYEEKYCIFDSKHAGRKRKFCLACRDCIAVEKKCRKLGDLNVSANSSTSVVMVGQSNFHLFFFFVIKHI